MASITFIAHDGTETIVETKIGFSVMEAATNEAVPGILGNCGGACACATCHVYVDEAWRAATGVADAAEKSMLESAFDVRENSRLSCQIVMTPALDGLIVHTPEQQ
jgi:2Fe-2S ferredoxin